MSFAKERERRANAGNRMRALLDQEVEMEDLFELDENEEEDEEFPVEEVEEEEDKVDSDFDLDSSEGEQEQIDEGKALDKQIEREERRARRTANMKTTVLVPKQTKAQQETPRKKRKLKQPAVSEEERQTRYSSRKNTVLSRILLEGQMKEEQKKKEQQPKKERPVVKQLTQEELLAEAAITEEKNKSSLLEWQQKEAERKENAKIKVKKSLTEPFVRYSSFIESRPDYSTLQSTALKTEKTSTSGSETEQISDNSTAPAPPVEESNDEKNALPTKLPLEYMTRNLITFVEDADENNSTYDMAVTESEDLVGYQDAYRSANGNNKDLETAELIEHLQDWMTRAPRPNKPILCPITGRIAKYRDPHTNVPYATIQAYNIIRECLQQKMNWSSVSGLFLGDMPSAKGVPDGWPQ